MAGENNLLNRIAALVATLDDAAWEVLASKGLLRRARKDLEKGIEVAVVGQLEQALQVRVESCVVTIPVAGLAKAACTCPAPEMCQHIVAAGLFLQTQASSFSSAPPVQNAESARQEIESIRAEQLKSWAGAVEYRAGLALLSRGEISPVIEQSDAVVVRFPAVGVEARFIPGAGLDGMILPKAQGKRIGVAAILAVQRSYGGKMPEAEARPALTEAEGAPRTRREVMVAARTVIEDAVDVGLAHVSSTLGERLQTLATSALGANLPRVSLALKAAADEVRAILRRDASADESRLLLLLARVYALMAAIDRGGDNPRADLVGTHRGEYFEVATLDLQGVGAYPWHTSSGYSGLTVLFWAATTKEFVSWSDARPAGQDFDAGARFSGDGPWQGAQSPSQVASSRFTLHNVRRTWQGRLSGSSGTSALVLGATVPGTIDFGERLFTTWQALRDYVQQKQSLGLAEVSPLDLIGVLEPASFGPRTFDSIRQLFLWEILDKAGDGLALSVPFREWSKDAIRTLENLEPPVPSAWQIVARLAVQEGTLVVEPVSILRSDDTENPVLHLSLVAQSQRRPIARVAERAVVAGTDVAGEEETILDEPAVPPGSYFQLLLGELNRRLQRIADAGCSAGLRGERAWLQEKCPEVHGSGLTSLSQLMDTLVKATQGAAAAVLRLRYLTYLYSQAATHLQ